MLPSGFWLDQNRPRYALKRFLAALDLRHLASKRVLVGPVPPPLCFEALFGGSGPPASCFKAPSWRSGASITTL